MNTLTHSPFLALRQVRQLLWQRWLVFSLARPVFWLVLYGQSFRRVSDLPGFQAGSYISFLTPGIVVMTALYSASWSGMGIIMEYEVGPGRDGPAVGLPSQPHGDSRRAHKPKSEIRARFALSTCQAELSATTLGECLKRRLRSRAPPAALQRIH